LTQHLHVETRALRLAVDVLDVVAERLALLLQTLDPLDQAAQPVAGDAADLVVAALSDAESSAMARPFVSRAGFAGRRG
jgi:hypothetical protein